MINQPRDGEAFFALGLALPLFAGGNMLFSLDPEEGMYIFDLVSIVAARRLFRSNRATEIPMPGAALLANSCLLVLGSWWMATLLLRPSGPRAFLEAQGIFCGILLFIRLSRYTLSIDTVTCFLRGLLLGTLGTAAFGQYQYWVAFPRTIPLAQAAGIPAIALVNANFYNANCYAAFLAAVILLVAVLAISNGELLAWPAIGALIVTILLTRSRSAIALLAVGGTGLGWIAGWWQKASRSWVTTDVVWVLLPAAAGVAAASVDLNEIWQVGAAGRLTMWRGSLEIVRDHWLFGVGLGRFGGSFAQFRVNDYHTLYPHSFLLEITAELGVVGLVGLVGFLGAAFTGPVSRLVAAARLSRSNSVDPPSLAICAAASILLVHGLVDIDWHAPANPILLFILLGALQQLSAPSEGSRDT